MIPMLLMQNAETINRLVNQGEFILKTYHAEYEKDPAGGETEFLRGLRWTLSCANSMCSLSVRNYPKSALKPMMSVMEI